MYVKEGTLTPANTAKVELGSNDPFPNKATLGFCSPEGRKVPI